MPIEFNSKTETFWLLSNFANIGFVYDGRRWPSVEHYYQAHKFLDTEIFEAVAAAETAKKAMKLAHRNNQSVRADWDEVKMTIMEVAVSEKVTQNRKVRKLLLSTDTEDLMHKMPNLETFWGVDSDGNGENQLGKLLQRIRSALQTT